ncbi:hypothetical protein [Streptomyces sp. NPDC001661]
MRKLRRAGAVALLTAGLTFGVAGTAGAAGGGGYGEDSPAQWQSGGTGYALGCSMARWLFHTHCK